MNEAHPKALKRFPPDVGVLLDATVPLAPPLDVAEPEPEPEPEPDPDTDPEPDPEPDPVPDPEPDPDPDAEEAMVKSTQLS